MIELQLTLAPSSSCIKVSSKKEGGRVQLSFPGHYKQEAAELALTGPGKVLHCKLVADRKEIVFDATLSPIGAAVRFAGEPDEEDAGRINLDLAQTEMPQLLEIAAFAPGFALFLDITIDDGEVFAQ